MSHSPDSCEPFGLRSYFLWACVNAYSAFPSTGWWRLRAINPGLLPNSDLSVPRDLPESQRC